MFEKGGRDLMSLYGKGALAIWNDVDCEAEREFLNWHVHEHIPERVSMPGFLRGRRYAALDAAPKFFNFYETSHAADLWSPVYRTELDNPSRWTRSVVQSFRNTIRVVCDVSLTTGYGQGGFVETLRLETELAVEKFRQHLVDSVLCPVSRQPGIVGVHLLEARAGVMHEKTEEAKLRGSPDGAASWMILVEAADISAVVTLSDELLDEGRLRAAGANAGISRGVYALQFSLTKGDLNGEDPKLRRGA